MAQSSTPPAAKTYKIYVVLWRGWEEAAQGFKDYLEETHTPFELIVRDANLDKSKIPGFVAEARDMDVDLIVTWGTTVTREMLGKHGQVDPSRHITERPALFMIVSQPVGSNIVSSLNGSGRNITGVAHIVPEQTQIMVARSYIDIKRIGMLYNERENNAEVTMKNLKALQGPMGFELIARPIPIAKDGKPSPKSIPILVEELARTGIDMFYIGPDSFMTVHADKYTEAAAKFGIPVFAASEIPVQDYGALMGVVNRYRSIGKLAAQKARDILINGANPSDMKIEQPNRFSIIINMTAARNLKLYPPLLLLKAAELIH
ncbi:MAG: ABC transporter substrate-binding protein [Magnetovibrio sp.]|nr:ABC transporter substrate-binding protein [Magnetovibrio sp.]